jgi:D-alanyl-D-alanine dipeptidase
VAAQHPTWSAARVEVATSLHVAPPHLAPHCAGAAVDLTLRDDDGELDLGTAIDATPEESDTACYTRHPTVVGQARANRDLLSMAMASAGFVNYGPEWWHWSFGDRYWAFQVGAPAALYGDVALYASPEPTITPCDDG